MKTIHRSFAQLTAAALALVMAVGCASPNDGAGAIDDAQPATTTIDRPVNSTGLISTAGLDIGADTPGLSPLTGDHVVTGDPEPAGLERLSSPQNTILSSNGAYLQSAGICGGASTGFDINSQGFEWLQVGVANLGSNAVSWGRAWQVAQNYRVHYPLPIANASKVYVVVGWDWTAAGWESRVVITSFDRLLDGYYSTAWC